MHLRSNAQEAGEMAQWLGPLAVLPEGLHSVPNAHVMANNLPASQGTKYTGGAQTIRRQSIHSRLEKWLNS